MKKIPLEAFFKNRERFNFIFSPNFLKMAFIDKYEKRTNIFIKDMLTEKETVITTQQKRNISTFYWKGNDHLLYLQDDNGDENYHLYMVNIKTKQTTDLTPWENIKVLDLWTLNAEYFLKKMSKYKNKIIVWHNKSNKGVFDVYFVDIKTKEHTLIAKNTLQTDKLIFDFDQEKFLYEVETKSGGSDLYLLQSGRRKKLFFIDSKDTFFLQGLDQSKDNIYYLSNIGKDKISLFKSDIEFKNKPQILFEHNEVDLEAVKLNYLTRNLEYVVYFSDKKNRHYFDQKLENKHHQYIKLLVEKFPTEKNNEIEVMKNIFNDNIIYITTHADNKLASEYYIAWQEKKIFKLSTDDKYLIPKNLVNMHYVKYQARDGLTIYAYLTLPKNFKKPMPIIVNPHGGPWHRDFWGYNPEIQFLANNGYGIFQPNFRISTGYGKAHFVKGWKEWGKKCQDDITDGTNWLIDQGYTKPGMIGIYGGSYGGYATLMGIIKEPKLYAAAIDYVGISDLFTFWDGFPPYWKQKGNIFEEAMGNPYQNEKLAKEVSPIYHIKKIETPLMVVQGGQDPRVPKKQAELIVNGLKANGKYVEYFLKDDEGHGFANQENKFELYRKMIIFLDKHLKRK